MAQSKPRSVRPAVKRTETLCDLAHDLQLLGVNAAVSDMGRAKELCERKINELSVTNGTLHKISSYDQPS